MTEIDWAALELNRGAHPLGAKGHESVRATLATSSVETIDKDVRRNRLEVPEIDDFLAYAGWNLWDLPARRSSSVRAAAAHHSHQDVLLSWLASCGYVFVDSLCQLIDEGPSHESQHPRPDRQHDPRPDGLHRA